MSHTSFYTRYSLNVVTTARGEAHHLLTLYKMIRAVPAFRPGGSKDILRPSIEIVDRSSTFSVEMFEPGEELTFDTFCCLVIETAESLQEVLVVIDEWTDVVQESYNQSSDPNRDVSELFFHHIDASVWLTGEWIREATSDEVSVLKASDV